MSLLMIRSSHENTTITTDSVVSAHTLSGIVQCSNQPKKKYIKYENKTKNGQNEAKSHNAEKKRRR